MNDSKKAGTWGCGRLSETDETVLDIIGRESATLESVRVEDSDIVFGNEVVLSSTLSVEGDVAFYLVQIYIPTP